MKKVLFALLVLAASVCATPWLGATFKRVTHENHLALRIIGVHPESGCFTAGVVADDLIVGIQGKVLTDISQVQDAVSKGKAGQSIKLDVVRGEKKLALKVKLTDRPDDISSLTGSAIGSKIAKFGENFYQNGAKRKDKPKATLLDFWATWCGPCRSLQTFTTSILRMDWK